MSEKRLIKLIENAGDYMVELFHLIGLFVIGATVIWSGCMSISTCWRRVMPA